MAVHSALQVFNPATRGSSDGLYKYRHSLFFGGVALPGTMASLAFINPESAYLSQGAFCTLPIRPFWYRLALAWIPRYLVAAIIVSLAIAIYAYVGFEFRSYANASQSIQTPTTLTTKGDSPVEDAEAAGDAPEPTGNLSEGGRRASSIDHDVVASHRRGSAVVVAAERNIIIFSPSLPSGQQTQSLPGSSTQLPLKRSLSSRPPLIDIPSGYSIKPQPSLTLSEEPHGGPLSPLAPGTEDPFSSHNLTIVTSATDTASTPTTIPIATTPPTSPHLRRQRARIHRQLRFMFIYPLVYTLMWLIPFVQHCMMYSDYFAHHPMWFFRIGGTICITSMGFIDCLIFSLREKPWRSIQTSDGTIWGSLAVWRSPRLSNAGLGRGRGGSRSSSAGGVMLVNGDTERLARIRSSVRTSASDDFTRIAAEQARVRLDMEREERLARMKERVVARRKASTVSEGFRSEMEFGDGDEIGESKYRKHSEKEKGDDGVEEGKGKDKDSEVVDMVDRRDWGREKEGD